MFSFFVSFGASALLTMLVIKHTGLHGAARDADFLGVQKVHCHSVARIGGLPIFIAMLLSACLWQRIHPTLTPSLLSLTLCGACAFVGGIVEDYTGTVSASRRLLMTMLAAVLAYFLADAKLERFDMPFSVWSITTAWLALPLTVLAVAGIANAVNIIDGFNGLASMVTICMLFSLAYVAWQVGDVFVLSASLMVAGATAGFLI